MRSSVVLVNPPQAKACEPPPGILALAGRLVQKGVSVALFDANLAVQESLISGENLAACLEELSRQNCSGAQLTSAKLAIKRGPSAFTALSRSETYQNSKTYRAAADAVRNAFKAVSLARNFNIDISDLALQGLTPLSSKDLALAAKEPKLLPIYKQLKECASRILAHDPSLIGLSASYLSQALPAFALAGILRGEGFNGTLVLGGALVSSWLKSLKSDSPFFDVWDAVAAGPGERILESLVKGADPTYLPGILAPKLKIWNAPKPDMAEACFNPETEGLLWKNYLSPSPILPVAASRSCYWNKCKFCPDPNQFSAGINAPDFPKLIETINQASDRINAQWVHFTDSALHSKLLKTLAVGDNKRKWQWYGFARPENLFLDANFCRALAQGGCAMLQLGIETVSQRLLNSMGKGAQAKKFAKMLSNLSQAEIRTYVYLLFGIPSETEADAHATLHWTEEQAEQITFINMSILNMPRYSEDYSQALSVKEPNADDLDLSLYRKFQIGSNWNRSDVRRKLATAKTNEKLRKILARTPPGFTSSHAAFISLT